jgi:hypothetical protein
VVNCEHLFLGDEDSLKRNARRVELSGDNMDTTTILIIVLIILLLGGGGWYGRGRWF